METPDDPAPSVEAKIYNEQDELIYTYLSNSVQGKTDHFLIMFMSEYSLDKVDGYYYVKLTIDSTEYFSDVFRWTDDIRGKLKIKTETTSLRINDYQAEYNYLYTEFFVKAAYLGIKPNIVQQGNENKAITDVLFGSRSIIREFDIDANDSIYIYLSALGLMQVNGEISLYWGSEYFNAVDILVEESTNHTDGFYQLKLSFVDEKETVSTMNIINDIPISFPTNYTPTLTTSEASLIGTDRATLGGEVISSGGSSVTERGIIYSISSNPTIENTRVIIGSGIGIFGLEITGLTDNTAYYFRSYAVNSAGLSYGEIKSFNTLLVSPFATIETLSVQNITNIGADFRLDLISKGASNIIRTGFDWGIATDMDNGWSTTGDRSVGVYTKTINWNMPSNTLIYYRGWIENSVGRTNGDILSFTTLP
jgi:hypothetical protein